MASKRWSLTSGAANSDTNFLNSFHIELTGEVSVDSSRQRTQSTVPMTGWVAYKVSAEKPQALKYAPSFITEGTISFIKTNVKDYVSRQFATKFLLAFSKYRKLATSPSGTRRTDNNNYIKPRVKQLSKGSNDMIPNDVDYIRQVLEHTGATGQFNNSSSSRWRVSETLEVYLRPITGSSGSS